MADISCFQISVFGILICLCGAGRAQTIYGPGGMFVHPSAFVSPPGAVELNLSYFTQTIGAQTRTEWLPISLMVGVTPRLEVGGIYLNHRVGSHWRGSGGAFAKYQILSDTPTRPAFALAGSFLTGNVRQSSLAGAFSHAFTRNGRTPITLHGGLQWARRDDLLPPADGIAGFAGVEAPLGRDFRLIGEVGTQLSFNRREASAIGLIWSPRKDIRVGISYVNTGRSKDNEFLVGVGYQLGGKK